MRTTERKAVLRKFPPFNKPTALDVEMDDVLHEMHEVGVNDPKYPNLLSTYERLDKLKAPQRSKRLSRDAIVNGLVSFAGIFLIVAYEQRGHVITSKAFNLLPRQNKPS